MPSLLESVTALLGEGDTLDKLGELMGGNKEQALAATGLATPVVLGGVADVAAQESGLDAVMGMLNDNSSVLNDLGGFLDAGRNEAGNNVLDAVLGDGRADVVSALAAKADIGSSLVGKLLPVLAPIVMGVINKRRTDDGLDDAAVGLLLAEERASLEKDGLYETSGAKLAAVGASVVGVSAVMSGGGQDKVDDGAGAAGGAAVGANDPVSEPIGGPASEPVSEPIGDTVSEPASSPVDDAASGMVGTASSVTETASESKETAKETAKGAAAAVAGAAGASAAGVKAVGAGMKGPAGGSDDDGTGTLGWLWWALGAIVLVLLLAWLLSTCNDESNDAQADLTSADADADGSDSASDSASDSDSTDSDADLQAAVDGALAGTGATGKVAGGVVTLTGTVDTDDDAAAAEDAVAELDGVASVDNELEVDGAAESESEADGDDGDDEDVDASVGVTINELLDLDPVTFRVSSARITGDGILVLDSAAGFLEANPDVNIEIGGHTDSDGTDAENLDLSQRRADSVKAYLVSKGIDGDRMETQGYGESEPKTNNSSASAKAENRRIEFTIV